MEWMEVENVISTENVIPDGGGNLHKVTSGLGKWVEKR